MEATSSHREGSFDVRDYIPESWLAGMIAAAPSCFREVDVLNLALARAMDQETVYPSGPKTWFRALSFSRPEEIKVVILGQDPYHSPGADGLGVADGLAFSCRKCTTPQPSLDNILVEAGVTAGKGIRYDLSPWAAQHVLLLNTTLTVARGQPQSHSTLPWAPITQGIVAAVSALAPHAVFMLWGRSAQSLRAHIKHQTRHLILETSHPSPFSVDRGFKGSQHFAKANVFLDKHKLARVSWTL
jgi:uracil-DNA glycosylase